MRLSSNSISSLETTKRKSKEEWVRIKHYSLEDCWVMERGCQNCFLQSLLYLSKRLDLTQSFKSVINFAITESQAGREGGGNFHTNFTSTLLLGKTSRFKLKIVLQLYIPSMNSSSCHLVYACHTKIFKMVHLYMLSYVNKDRSWSMKDLF